MAGTQRAMMIGQPQAAEAGLRVMAEGGNAVDAAVTGGLVAGTVALLSTGIAGYGGHMVIAWRNGKVRVVDFNTEAPARLPDRVDQYGWRSVGVPGVLAGLELAAHRYGTRTFRQCLGPAIRYAGEGFDLPEPLGRAIGAQWAPHFSQDEGARVLFGRDGKPLGPGDQYLNPDLARLLERLARDNSAESFYRGEIARALAAEFARRGGTVTAADLAAYHAREVEPIAWTTGEHVVYTAPLTSGGLTTVQALRSLDQVRGDVKPGDAGWHHARLEALRIAWRDRLDLLGDPAFRKIPVERLLSSQTAVAAAARIRGAVAARRALAIETRPLEAGGTTHLSVCDPLGNMVALTLTHGDGFGARAVAPGLGLLLGHGLSRFDLQAPSGHVNAPQPRKRPLHNMCPTIVCRRGRPVIAAGATGGRRIPNALFDVLSRMLFESMNLPRAVAAPRMNTTGGREVSLSGGWPEADRLLLESAGFVVKQEGAAVIQALALEPDPVTAGG